ncbi:MAG: hypothetical protein WAQ52_18045 [Terriglobales bacterium]
MKTIRIQTLFTLALAAGFVALTMGATSVSASDVRSGKIHVIKDCSGKTGEPGSFCVVTSSNLPEIVVGSKVFYFQSPIASTGLQDSNVVLDAGDANRAVGHCTLDLSTRIALCTFSEGTGTFIGFHARIDGSPGTDATNYHWDGTYHFTRQSGNE